MAVGYPSFALTSAASARTLLVRALDAIRLCRDEGFAALSRHQTESMIEGIRPKDLRELRLFLGRAGGPRVPAIMLDDRHIVGHVRSLVRVGEVVAIRENGGKTAGGDSVTLERRRLVRNIETQLRGGRLAQGGRSYKLVVDVDLGHVPDRDSYEVVRQAEAQHVLTTLAAQAGAQTSGLGKLLEEACDHITANWRPPLAPDGLVLLRRIPHVTTGAEVTEAALTPSQMKQLTSDWIELELVDEDGVPYIGSYSLELPNATTVDGTFDGRTFDEQGGYSNHSIDPGNCKLFVPGKQVEDELEVTVVDEVGKPVAGIAMVFKVDGSNLPATTDGAGIAKRKVPGSSSAQVSFANAADLAKTMAGLWAKPRETARTDWVQADENTSTVSLFGGQVVTVDTSSGSNAPLVDANLTPFEGVEVALGATVKLSVQPLIIMASMLGEHFDTDKCFLLPKALASAKDLVRLHKQYAATDMVIVGHTDTSGNQSHNLDLSLDRALAMKAYLTNDADAWLAWYGSGKPASQRWGETEDNLMIGALLGDGPLPPTVLGYQQWHNGILARPDGYETLTEDGAIGPLTRKQLVLDYMNREDTSVPEGTTIEVHGCGEEFPLEDSGETLDADAEDGQHEVEDRRVEVFLFPKEVGIAPPVPGPKASAGEKEYPEWRLRAVEADFAVSERQGNCVVSVVLVSNSGNVVLAKRPYELRIDNGPILDGTTDEDGFLEHTQIPAGDHLLYVDGCESRVGATPPSCRRRRHMMAGYVLIPGEDV